MGSEGALLLGWFEDFITGLSCPEYAKPSGEITNRQYEAMKILSMEYVCRNDSLRRAGAKLK